MRIPRSQGLPKPRGVLFLAAGNESVGFAVHLDGAFDLPAAKEDGGGEAVAV